MKKYPNMILSVKIAYEVVVALIVFLLGYYGVVKFTQFYPLIVANLLSAGFGVYMAFNLRETTKSGRSFLEIERRLNIVLVFLLIWSSLVIDSSMIAVIIIIGVTIGGTVLSRFLESIQGESARCQTDKLYE